MDPMLQPDFFPTMLVMLKASRTLGMNDKSQHCSIPIGTTPLQSGELQEFSNRPALLAQLQEPTDQIVEASKPQKQAIFVCPQYHSNFLIYVGLEKCMQSMQTHPSKWRSPSKVPRVDTVQAALNRTPIDIPVTSKSFVRPLCLDTIGRKGLAGHLCKEHQIDKLDETRCPADLVVHTI